MTGPTVARVLAPMGVVIGGLAVVIGSLATWGSCTQMPCDPGGGVAIFVIVDFSGVELGFGIVTMLAGLTLAVVGLLALGQRGVTNRRRVAAISTALVLVTVAAAMVWDFVLRVRSIDGPEIGVWIVVSGALLAGVAGALMLPESMAQVLQAGPADQDAKAIDEAERMLRDGWSEAEVIDFLRDSGLSWIRSVRALALATGKGVGYAKPAVLDSDTWADERPRINAMHAEIVASLEHIDREGHYDDKPRRDTD